MADEGIQVTFHRNKQTRSMPSFQTELSFGLAGLVVVLGVAVVVTSFQGSALVQKWDHGCEQLQHVDAFGKMLTNHCKLCSFQGQVNLLEFSGRNRLRRQKTARSSPADCRGKSPHHQGIIEVSYQCPSPSVGGLSWNATLTRDSSIVLHGGT